MEKQRKLNIIGIVVGAVAVLIGFLVMNPATHTLGTRNAYGSLISFGGDFYTEMYSMTFQVANQVQNAYVNICNAVGWLIVVVGALAICYFTGKLLKSTDSDETVNLDDELYDDE